MGCPTTRPAPLHRWGLGSAVRALASTSPGHDSQRHAASPFRCVLVTGTMDERSDDALEVHASTFGCSPSAGPHHSRRAGCGYSFRRGRPARRHTGAAGPSAGLQATGRTRTCRSAGTEPRRRASAPTRAARAATRGHMGRGRSHLGAPAGRKRSPAGFPLSLTREGGRARTREETRHRGRATGAAAVVHAYAMEAVLGFLGAALGGVVTVLVTRSDQRHSSLLAARGDIDERVRSVLAHAQLAYTARTRCREEAEDSPARSEEESLARALYWMGEAQEPLQKAAADVEAVRMIAPDLGERADAVFSAALQGHAEAWLSAKRELVKAANEYIGVENRRLRRRRRSTR